VAPKLHQHHQQQQQQQQRHGELKNDVTLVSAQRGLMNAALLLRGGPNK